MAIRRETKHSMLRRCQGWDYRQPCIYQITLVLSDRRSQALGRLEIGEVLGLPPQAQNHLPREGDEEVPSRSVLEAAASSRVILSPAGEAVFAEFRRIGEHHPDVRPLLMQVMPDHVHFILRVMQVTESSSGPMFSFGFRLSARGETGWWAEDRER